MYSAPLQISFYKKEKAATSRRNIWLNYGNSKSSETNPIRITLARSVGGRKRYVTPMLWDRAQFVWRWEMHSRNAPERSAECRLIHGSVRFAREWEKCRIYVFRLGTDTCLISGVLGELPLLLRCGFPLTPGVLPVDRVEDANTYTPSGTNCISRLIQGMHSRKTTVLWSTW